MFVLSSSLPWLKEIRRYTQWGELAISWKRISLPEPCFSLQP